MGDERQITIALADDHNVIRAGLRSMLEAEPGLRVVGEAADAESAAKLAHDRRPDVLVLDLQMPGAEPATDIASLRESVPGMAVVVLTMDSDPRKARNLLRAGAAGFVLKQAAERNLTDAIRAAAEGGSYIDPELGGALAKLEADPLDGLSARERGPDRQRPRRLFVVGVKLRGALLLGHVEVAEGLATNRYRYPEERVHRWVPGREAVGVGMPFDVGQSQGSGVPDQLAEDAPPARQVADLPFRLVVDAEVDEALELGVVGVQHAERCVPG